MKVPGGILSSRVSSSSTTTTTTSAFPKLFLHRHSRSKSANTAANFRCSYSAATSDHISYIKDVAATRPPEHLNSLLNMLQSKGTITALLRWPTAPPGMEMPVVEVRQYGVWLLAKNVDQYIHRILAEADANNPADSSNELFDASSEAGRKLYRRGDFSESKLPNLDVYLLKKVGMFPDILERKVMQHFEKGDHVSAMVTGEFYTNKEHFPGFGRPFVFNAEVLLKVGRNLEAKDAARGALKSPWWTLGCRYQEVAEIAEWEDEQIEFIKEKVSEQGKQEDLQKGKAPAQVSLDEAAFLLDLASIDGTWSDFEQRIAECYEEAGLHDISKFVLHRD
ncbi:uncharacterized protein LOC113298129 isoform X2 [Papaver somniferum]|uniref:uncharacterized protein LOC113298129 isoform X2 n=1 Tax=Papaver somniferum TaxID=3469 RepID=UPI000E6FE242|nr:uncharacterized protein LOC113298129 isoform X2 [Papaver somniferum]